MLHPRAKPDRGLLPRRSLSTDMSLWSVSSVLVLSAPTVLWTEFAYDEGMSVENAVISGRRPSGRARVVRRLALVLIAVLGWSACHSGSPPGVTPTGQIPSLEGGRTFALMAINDVYRIAGVRSGAVGGLARVRTLRQMLERQHPDLLLLHAGDFLYPSLLSREFDGAQMIDIMNQLDGAADAFDERMVVTFGNHEFDKDDLEDAPRLAQRVRDAAFHWLASDIEFASGPDGRPLINGSSLANHLLVDSGGVRVGLFSLTIDDKHPEYVARFRAAEVVARESSAALRAAGAEVVVALTHLRLAQDLALLERLGAEGPDLVIGGHEHNQIARQQNGRWVLKADADAVSATVALVSVAADGGISVDHRVQQLGSEVPPDPMLEARVADWLRRHDQRYCRGFDPARPPGCLDDILGTTQARLKAEELDIRRHETNMGNWIADRARAAFATSVSGGAQVAFVNSGALRLNQDVDPGPVTRRNLEELFPYDTQLVMLRVSGAVLHAAIEHAVADWTGNGKFMQVSGFAFRHDPRTERVERVTLLTPSGPRPLDDDEMVTVVTSTFLVNPEQGQDGYTMLRPEQRVPGTASHSLREAVMTSLAAAGADGIAPQVEGRICNALFGGPCLALP